jgi:hypothetical protein
VATLGFITTDQAPKRDVYQRARLFDAASFTHHAKANLNLLQSIVDRYSQPGDLLIDPMGGAGSILVGLLTGRRVIVGDVESQWARLLRDNHQALHHQSIIAFNTPGLPAQWDAAKLPLASGQGDLFITSPPYFDTFSDWDATSNLLVERDHVNEHGISYGVHPRQLANIHVYEAYLRAMLAVYQEVWRTLSTSGKLVLILKDVIRGGRRVPVVEDNLCLARCAGFRLLERFDVPARGTRFRNVNKARLGQAGPEFEPVLVLEKQDPKAKQRLALVEVPKPEDGPGRIIALKAINHARRTGFEVWTRSPGEREFHPTSGENRFDQAISAPGDESAFQRSPERKARIRKETAFSLVRDLVVKAGLGAGDQIAFYGSDERYGRYICRRLETLNCLVTKPLYGLNNGRRLRWLTEQINKSANQQSEKGKEVQ